MKLNVEEKTTKEAGFMVSVLHDLVEQFKAKNVDYGDSMGVQCRDWGDITPIIIRMGDKMNRAKSLVKNKECLVSDESIEDTLVDLITYGLMALYELKEEET
jgi:hypothetical protein